MWPFSYFKKLKEEKIRRAQEELRLAEEAKQKAIAERKTLYNTYKEYIDDIVKAHNKDQAQKRNNYIDKKEKENKESNHKCPRCGCTETIEVFRRPKGELTHHHIHMAFLVGMENLHIHQEEVLKDHLIHLK